jgi:heat shock protein HslJ/uncharacterized membrane protein
MQKNYTWVIFGLITILAACGGTKPKTTATPTTDRNTRLLEKGVSFFAYGQEPFWNLEVYDGKEIRFEGINNQSFTHAITDVLPIDKQKYSLVYNTSAGAYIFEVNNQTCTDIMSGEKHPIKVAVLYGGDTLHGCGMNIYDKRINGKWIITKINNKNIPQHLGSNNIPQLEINGDSSTISGSTGCNRFNGKFVLRNYKIHMGNLATTKMACANAMESAFLAVFNNLDSYQINNTTLLLTNKEGITCEFTQTK